MRRVENGVKEEKVRDGVGREKTGGERGVRWGGAEGRNMLNEEEESRVETLR